MTTYHTHEEIDQWLSENGYFEDVYVLQVESNPVSIIVGYTIKGNYRAHSEHHIRLFKIIPSDIISMSPLTLIPQSEIGCYEAIEPLETSEGVGMRILSSPYFDIVANAYTILDEGILKTTFRPWTNPECVTVQFPSNHVPTPAFWKTTFKENGFDIAFRFYGGKEIQPKELPYPNYAGYFIQLADMIPQTIQGLFISFITNTNGLISLTFEKRDEELTNKDDQLRLNKLWNTLTKILFNIPKVVITSGNCKFQGDEWEDFQSGKSRPPSGFWTSIKKMFTQHLNS